MKGVGANNQDLNFVNEKQPIINLSTSYNNAKGSIPALNLMKVQKY